MSAPVFLAERSAADPLSRVEPGDTYVLDGAEGRHAGVVQRRRAGERVDVVDGEGTRLLAVVVRAERDTLELRVEAVETEPEPAVRLVLVQALAKGDRDELAIEAATEVGVDAVLPWQAERSVVVWRGDRAARSRARWLATVRAAAKQSRRARVPEVRTDVTTTALADVVRETVAAGGRVAVLHEDATEPLGTLALPEAGAPGAPTPEVLVVVGPEGGISDAELERLTEAGGRPVRLGPHVLRTSTAGPVALTLLCERLGRWA
ncbi:16S rRNA (uracil(1498)-N(3))-methyltransferase [Luteimicrobium sp. DT211]|uniref:16S rRNA (uracil(1498)-N(3))-methyltransferase n=1 Tax=Luteimicrobium sp. DT211 TaxID=3393412 RepID=UPI003CF36554